MWGPIKGEYICIYVSNVHRLEIEVRGEGFHGHAPKLKETDENQADPMK